MKQDSADVLGDSLRNDSCSSALFLAKQRGSEECADSSGCDGEVQAKSVCKRALAGGGAA